MILFHASPNKLLFCRCGVICISNRPMSRSERCDASNPSWILYPPLPPEVSRPWFMSSRLFWGHLIHRCLHAYEVLAVVMAFDSWVVYMQMFVAWSWLLWWNLICRQLSIKTSPDFLESTFFFRNFLESTRWKFCLVLLTRSFAYYALWYFSRTVAGLQLWCNVFPLALWWRPHPLLTFCFEMGEHSPDICID